MRSDDGMHMMFDEEQEVRAALHKAFDVPAPPPKVDATAVIKRGRRRLLVQRVGSLAGVVAIVGGITAGTIWLRESLPDTTGSAGQVLVGSDPPATSTPPSQLPGWTVVPPPSTVQAPAEEQRAPGTAPTAPTAPSCGTVEESTAKLPIPLQKEADVKAALQQALVGIAPELASKLVSTGGWGAADGWGRLEATLSRGQRYGQLSLTAGVFGGTPEKQAEVQAATQCGSAQRTTLANGSVVQIYAFQSTDMYRGQLVEVFTTAGRRYSLRLTMAIVLNVPGTGVSLPASPENAGSPDAGTTSTRPTTSAGSMPGGPTGRDRESWAEQAPPLSEAELATLGVRLGELG